MDPETLKAWFESLRSSLMERGVGAVPAEITIRLGAAILALILAILAYWLTRRILLRAVHHMVRRTRATWDDVLMQRGVFSRLSHISPAVVLYLAAPLILVAYPAGTAAMQTLALVYVILVGLLVLDALLNSLTEICCRHEFARRVPVRGFIQVAKILLACGAGIVILSMLLGKNPSALLAGMGAMTAVLLLIFKDAILGFVAGIQLSANEMVHIGDWIEMPKYGADGDVIDISLTTVKVRNWDKTITTIPAYALVSDSFRNWRGMKESGGRRIMRQIYIDMSTIRFCDQTMLDRFKKFQHIRDYIEQKKEELARWNREKEVDESELVNGRRLTNIGTFRAYLVAYLRHHPKIHPEMTFLVRHLQPTPEGLPIQIYVFSSDQVWANYEAIQADIFDHILAVVPEFGLRVFQNPSGYDFRTSLARERA